MTREREKAMRVWIGHYKDLIDNWFVVWATTRRDAATYIDAILGEPDVRSLKLLDRPGMIDFSLRKEEEDDMSYYVPFMDRDRKDGINLEMETLDYMGEVIEGPVDENRPFEVSKVASQLGISDPETLAMYGDIYLAEGDADKTVAIPEFLWEVILSHFRGMDGKAKLSAPTVFGDNAGGMPRRNHGVHIEVPLSADAQRLIGEMLDYIEDTENEELEDEDGDKDFALDSLRLAKKVRTGLTLAEYQPGAEEGKKVLKVGLTSDEFSNLISWIEIRWDGAQEDKKFNPGRSLYELRVLGELKSLLAKAAVAEIEQRLKTENGGGG